MKKFRPLFTLVVAAVIIFGALMALDKLFTTNTGLRWLFSAAQHLIPGKLEAKSIQGIFFGDIQIEDLHYRNKQFDLSIHHWKSNWQPDDLLQNKLRIYTLHIDGLTWRTITPASEKKLIWPHWRFPLHIWIEDLQLKNVVILPVDIHIQLQGSVTDNWNLSGQLQQNNNPWSRSIIMTGSLSGPYKAPCLIASINAYDVHFEKIKANSLKAKSIINLALDKNSQINSKINNLRYEQFVFPSITVDAIGNFKQQALQVQITPDSVIRLPEYGIQLQDVKLNASLLKKTITWFASARSGKGDMRVDGQTSMASPDFPTTLSLHSNNFVVSNTVDYRIIATSDIAIKFLDKRLDMTGKIFLPTALLKLDTENTQAVSLSHDVVFVNDQQTQTMLQRLAISAQINLQLGNDVQLVFQGLRSKLQGALAIRELPAGAITAVGQINLVEGQYVYSNQTLTITSGSRFVYAGGDITNPALNIQAVKTITALLQTSSLLPNGGNIVLPGQPTKIIVGIQVRGDVKEPQLSLFSQPASLSQADILSYILFDEPSDQISGIDAQLLFTAASSLNIGKGTTGEFKHLMQTLQKTIKLDKFSIENSPYFNPSSNTLQQNTSLVLGKALSPKLYISYSVGLLQPVNIFQVRYLLNKYWSLQSTSSSLASGVDLLYTIERD